MLSTKRWSAPPLVSMMQNRLIESRHHSSNLSCSLGRASALGLNWKRSDDVFLLPRNKSESLPNSSLMTATCPWPRHRLIINLCDRVGPLPLSSASQPSTTTRVLGRVDLPKGVERISVCQKICMKLLQLDLGALGAPIERDFRIRQRPFCHTVCNLELLS